MENKNGFSSSFGALGLTLGLSLILSTIVGSYAFYKIRTADDTLSVTGSASVEVSSDQAKWVSSLSRQVKVSGLKAGYTQMAADLKTVLKFYEDHGITAGSLVISPVYMDEIYDYRQGSEYREKEYNLRQTIELASSDVNAVTALARDAATLAEAGVIFQTQSLEYYYSKLPELRVTLLSEAIRDAKARATEIAEPSGQKVGPLKEASSGVVQVLSANSVDISDYGAYDTSKIEKKVMVTVRAAFSIR